MTVTSEGLRIELSEGEQNAFFFESGNASPTSFGQDILAKLANEISKMPNKVVIEGHTDAKSFGNRKDYTNWELSSDRANAARRLMEDNGIRPDQVSQVRGYADQKPREHTTADAASNRRVTVIVLDDQAPLTAAASTPAKTTAGSASPKAGAVPAPVKPAAASAPAKTTPAPAPVKK